MAVFHGKIGRSTSVSISCALNALDKRIEVPIGVFEVFQSVFLRLQIKGRKKFSPSDIDWGNKGQKGQKGQKG
ncbi:MAG: hypothetical protein IJJ33_06085, partial [Victivallales bacterium]|nr:hypothetical protein [Victivallales bacterium]